MDKKVKSKVELKQVVSAIKALQKHFAKKSKKLESGKKNLLEPEEATIHVTFTLT